MKILRMSNINVLLILVVVIFSFLKEVTGASSILEMFSLNFLKNLKN
ncbi:hypothetical protein [Fusobacterium polymorphum]